MDVRGSPCVACHDATGISDIRQVKKRGFLRKVYDRAMTVAVSMMSVSRSRDDPRDDRSVVIARWHHRAVKGWVNEEKIG